MRTPEQLRIDYVKNSGNWLKWAKGVQDEAWNAALDQLMNLIERSSFSVEVKETMRQMVEIQKQKTQK